MYAYQELAQINWESCAHAIDAIDFEASLEELQELAGILELLGIPLDDPVDYVYRSAIEDSEDMYFTIHRYSKGRGLSYTTERIAPIPTKYITTLIPMLLLAHIQDPDSVITVYNEFFKDKKEELTPLLST